MKRLKKSFLKVLLKKKPSFTLFGLKVFCFRNYRPKPTIYCLFRKKTVCGSFYRHSIKHKIREWFYSNSDIISTKFLGVLFVISSENFIQKEEWKIALLKSRHV